MKRVIRPRDAVRVCPVCGKTFVATKRGQKMCSPACVKARGLQMSKAYRRRIHERNAGRIRWESDHSCDEVARPRRDSLGLLVIFDEPAPGAACPLERKVGLDAILDFHLVGVPSVREVCAMRGKRRDLYTVEWFYSEYVAARRWLKKEARR